MILFGLYLAIYRFQVSPANCREKSKYGVTYEQEKGAPGHACLLHDCNFISYILNMLYFKGY